MYFTGTSWDPVFGTGHGVPAKDTTDNLDGTSSGGRFTLVLSSTQHAQRHCARWDGLRPGWGHSHPA